MKNIIHRTVLTTALAAGLLPVAAQAQSIIITEVNPTGSSSTYSADWFELKNTGASAVDITGWMMDDSSADFSVARALRGITSIAAGQTVVFLEGNATGTTDATIATNFISAWFGGSAPLDLVLGFYGGSGVGLSSTADAVNIYDSIGTLVANVSFNAAPSGATFDNTAGSSGAISQASVVGVNNAIQSFNGLEIGSPGNLAPVPEPSTLALAGLGLAAILGFRRSNRK
jgi:hypothetical protein